MNLADIRGSRFPDEYVIKCFFKLGFHQRTGDVLELGCGNGNNLMLFYQFGWNVVGLDMNPEALEDALFNFAMLDMPSCNYHFVEHDISKGVKNVVSGKFDVILMPNVLSYIDRKSTVLVMKDLRELLQKGTYIFLRTRNVRDYRYGRGEEIGHNTFRLKIEETGEQGLLNVFYHEYELIDILRDLLHVDVSTTQVFSVDFQNLQKGFVVSNSDIVIWGKIYGE